MAEYAGWMGYHVENVSGNIRNDTAEGFPDWVYAHPKLGIVFAELKNATRKPTAKQRKWLSVLHDAALVRPAESVLWRPTNWNDIERRILHG